MNLPRIGFIGFGEVAAIFSEAILKRHDTPVCAADVLCGQPDGAARLAQRDRTGRVGFVPLPELVGRSEWIFSTVTTSSAEPLAREVAPHLRRGQTFVDFNATAPAVKQAMAGIIAPTGAHFVEAAILSAVGVSGARARILIGDPRGAGSAELLTRLGLNAVFYSPEIGRASAFKLLRSIFSKGMEALLIEFLVAGRRAGLQEDLWREVVELFAEHGFERAATNWIQTHATAHERRRNEVVQVAAEMRALGLEPVMTAATQAFFERSCTVGLKDTLSDGTATVDAVVALLERQLGTAAASPGRSDAPAPAQPTASPSDNA
jgi:3-hydroxyisobutyrate dehydrogenase-like beta-hydroxyacid dehydrogenase